VSKAIDNLQAAQQRAMAGRPKVGGFPYLAEILRRAGVTRNLWFLPACESLYLTEDGPVVTQGAPLLSGTVDVAPFDRMHSWRHCEPTKPGGARSPSSWRPAGAPELCATMSISRRARLRITGAGTRFTQKAIQRSRLRELSAASGCGWNRRTKCQRLRKFQDSRERQ